ncbi:vitamin B12-binding protein precursor [archaeon BMS3Bbin15]|nr:vitamin B12-binding protein precursor [archaeon BMS3Bbin15]
MVMLKRAVLFFVVLLALGSTYGLVQNWNNSYTGDNSTYLPVPVNTSVNFSISLNQSQNVTWFLNTTYESHDSNVNSSSFIYNFTGAGTYKVDANSTYLNVSENVPWLVDVYQPLNIVSYFNNVTDSNSTTFNLSWGKSVYFNVNRSGTVVNEFWVVNGTLAYNGSTFIFSPEKYGWYNITYILNGKNSSKTLSWGVEVYLKVTDALNNTLIFYTPPTRIVTLAPSVTEDLFAVGMGKSLVGADPYSDYPPEISTMNITRVGGLTYGIKTEVIVNLTPDLVIAAKINPIMKINKLRSLNITVLATKSDNISEIMSNILTIGKIGNKLALARNVTRNMTQRIDKVERFSSSLSSIRKPSVFFVVWYPSLWTGGKGTYVNNLINMAGGVNVAGGLDGWKIINKEVLISKNPDIIICSGGMGATVCSNISKDSVLSNLKAVKDNKMYVVPDPNIVNRPGPRIVDGLDFFYNIIKQNLIPTPPENTIFTGKFQDKSEIREKLSKILTYKPVFEVENSMAVAPLLLSNRFPVIPGVVKKKATRLEIKDVYRYAATVALSHYFFAKEVIIARGDLDVDSYAAISLAKKKGIPILLTGSQQLPQVTLNAIKDLKLKKIIIVGGNNAVGNEVSEELSKYAETERIGGATRVETSIDIAKKMKPDNVIITDYNSSTEAAVLSSLYKVPVVYVSQNKLNLVIDFLKAYKPKVLFVDVSPSVKKRIEDEI